MAQTTDQQNAALQAAGVTKTFTDVMSGARDDRPGFAECLKYLREGDTLVVWRLDRLGRNMRSIVTVHDLTERGVTVKSIHDGIDTSTSTGRMVAGMLASLAEYERELVKERVALKLEHARKSGVKFGRPLKRRAGRVRPANEGQRGDRHHDLPDVEYRPDNPLPLLGR